MIYINLKPSKILAEQVLNLLTMLGRIETVYLCQPAREASDNNFKSALKQYYIDHDHGLNI